MVGSLITCRTLSPSYSCLAFLSPKVGELVWSRERIPQRWPVDYCSTAVRGAPVHTNGFGETENHSSAVLCTNDITDKVHETVRFRALFLSSPFEWPVSATMGLRRSPLAVVASTSEDRVILDLTSASLHRVRVLNGDPLSIRSSAARGSMA